MDTTRNDFRSMFIGGFVCSAIAFMFAPSYWWLGLLAGLALGSVATALTHNFRKTKEACGVVTSEVEKWFSESHPIIYFSISITLPVYFLNLTWLLEPYTSGRRSFPFLIAWMFTCAFLFVAVVSILLDILKDIGRYYRIGESKAEREKRFLSETLKCVAQTYLNVFCYVLKGLLYVAIILVWVWWTQKLRAFAIALYSKEMALCAFFGPLGGGVSFLFTFLAEPNLPASSKIAVCFFGGILGVAFGVFNAKYLSRPVLRILRAESVRS